MNYSLSQNLAWLKENKEAFLEKLNSMLDTPSGLTIHSSWDEISNFLQSMQTYLMDLSGGAVEQMERFLNNTIETAISISATAINDYSFYEKTSVTKIKADNATTVGNYAFYNCNNLVEANMPKVTTIGDYAFYNSKITTLESMPCIDTIGIQTFDTCTCLTGTLTLNNMTSIGTSAFKNCNNIEKIIITNSVTTVNTTLLYVRSSTVRPDGYKLKYIACEQSDKPSSWATNWNRIYNNSTSYQWPTYWNAGVKDWVFVYNNDKADTYWTGRVLEEFPNEGTKDGYTFGGWYSDSALINKVSVPLTLPTQIPCLYAKWSLNVTLFVYDLETLEEVNLGTHALSSLADIPSNKELGYAIEKWYLDEDCTIECTDFSQLTAKSPKLYTEAEPASVRDFEYTGNMQSLTLSVGTYELECWGAEGGHTSSSYAENYYEGKGGYSYGTLKVNEATSIYIYVGGKGVSNKAPTGGFNGGGNGNSTGRNTTSGGGGTDIRIGTNSLYSRVIVAGGGGGGRDAGGQGHVTTLFRSCAGGMIGYQGGAYSTSSVAQSVSSNYRGGGGGGQNTAGATGTRENSEILYPAGFGFGGYCGSTSPYGEGGGGGWYGGGAGSADADGGGGSGYVYSSETAENYPEGCLLNSDYYLTEAETKAGDQLFLSPEGVVETGHSGNGYIRITKIS